MKKNKSKQFANLRVCASCEWIFKYSDYSTCPKCDFAHYSAFYVYRRNAYRYEKTQIPWKQKKMFYYESILDKEIETWIKKKS
jgi:hypothetical protein